MQTILILVVDDEVSICESLTLKIGRLNHPVQYEVQSSTNGFEALRLIKSNDFDIVITDIRMPFMSGLTLTSKLREEGYKGIILALSGYDDYSYVRDAFISGVDDYLLKPIAIKILSQKLQDCIKTRERKEGTTESSDEPLSDNKTNIDYALDYIASHYKNPDLSMDTVAQHVHLSYSHFSSLFRHEMKMSFPAYLREYRIRRSIDFLTDPTIRIADISSAVGFHYPQQYSNDFKRVMGVYPSEYAVMDSKDR